MVQDPMALHRLLLLLLLLFLHSSPFLCAVSQAPRPSVVPLSTEAWQHLAAADGTPAYTWPEQQGAAGARLIASTANLGMAFSGGGTRSYIATLGYLRALSDLGIINRSRYVTGVSGGSWAVTPFMCVREGPGKRGLEEGRRGGGGRRKTGESTRGGGDWEEEVGLKGKRKDGEGRRRRRG